MIIIIPAVLVIFGLMATTVSATQYSLTLTGPQTVAAGKTFSISGTYTEDGVGKAGISVDIFDLPSDSMCSACHSKTGNTGNKIGSAITGEGGVYSMTVGPFSGGDYIFGALVVGSGVTHSGVESDPLNVHVSVLSVAPPQSVRFTDGCDKSVYMGAPTYISAAWDPSSDPDVAGYRSYWRVTSPSGESASVTIDVGLVTSTTFTFTPAIAGVYSIQLNCTAYTAASIEGDASNTAACSIYTSAPPTPLIIIAVDPSDNALNVPSDKVITVTFNKPVEPGANYSNISLTGGHTNVRITTAITSDLVTITPTNALSRDMTYTVTIPSDAVKNGTSTLDAGLVSHFTTEPKKPTTLTATALATASVTKNFTINGTLSAGTTGIADATITLQRSTDSSTWSNVTTNQTNASGDYQFSQNESAAGIYYYRTAYDGNDTYANATSNVVTVTVNKIPTQLSAAISPNIVAINKPFTINGTLNTTDGVPIAGVIVQLQKNVSGTWIGIAGKTNTTNVTGDYRISASELNAGTYQYRATYAGNDTYISSNSTTVSIKVVSKTSVLQDLSALRTTVDRLPASAFTHGTKVAALALINAANINLRAGNYAATSILLKNALLARTDGCAKNEKPDANDWVRTCTAQGQLYSQVLNIIKELQALQGS